MLRRRNPLVLVLVSVVVAGALGGCSDGGGSDAAPRATTTTTPGQTTTLPETIPDPPAAGIDPSPDGLPAGSLQPVSAEWATACRLADSLVDQAWQLQRGELTDPTVVGGTLLAMIEEVPAGAADEPVGFVGQLATAFVSGADLSTYEADFRTQADALLVAVGAGCGVAEGESLPLPADTVGTIERFLFG